MRRRHWDHLGGRSARCCAETSGPGRARRLCVAPVGEKVIAELMELEVGELQRGRGGVAHESHSLSCRLPSLGRTDQFTDRRWPGLAPDDHGAKKR